MFTYHIPTARTIELHSDHTLIHHGHFPGIGMKLLLPKLTERLSKYKEGASGIPVPRFKLDVPKEGDHKISHAYFWPRLGKFFRKQDVIVAETGTSNFGVLDVPMPDKSIFVSQLLFGSIGWATASTLGAALAARDRGLGRTILFTGDGSMKYNDIVDWKWTSLLTTLGDTDGKLSKSYTVRSKAELDKLLDDDEFASAQKIQLVEVLMDKYDTPRALQAAADLTAKMAAKSVG
ncbi:hypothetical protein AZE42_06733 [Rhizopogon vesiculosus]|uniref:Thiamine pyrophosphate enzyme TPP-binding domain-containing protein n=1 Tax=Rhizopogon vesiculosus TaxID=180088 RepID=A0A1J8PFJ6_9AGAM|nr:hypothetical protein AZE42_06733 [Rhizopogon vesiculosus]